MSARRMRSLMCDAESAGFDAQWVNLTPGASRPEYRWRSAGLDRWLERVCEWRAARVRPDVVPDRSGDGRIPGRQEDGGGTLMDLARRLSSADVRSTRRKL